MAGRIKLRLANGQTVSIGLCDAALDYLGVGPEAVFDGANFLVSRQGFHVESPNTDKRGHLCYVPDPIDTLTWADWFAQFRDIVNLDPRVTSIGGELALAAIAGWEFLEAQFVTQASAREGRRPKKLEPWGMRDEIVGAIAVKVAEGMKVLPAIRSILNSNPERFNQAFPKGTDKQRIEAAKRAYYRAFDVASD